MGGLKSPYATEFAMFDVKDGALHRVLLGETTTPSGVRVMLLDEIKPGQEVGPVAYRMRSI